MDLIINEYKLDKIVKKYRSKIRKHELKYWRWLTLVICPIWLICLVFDIYYEMNYAVLYDQKLNFLIFVLFMSGGVVSYTSRLIEQIIVAIAEEFIEHCSNNDDIS